MQNLTFTNPTAIIDLDFGYYLQLRSSELAAHLVGGIPDYAFSLDQKLRQQLTAMAPVRAIAQSLVSFAVPFYKQIQQMQAVAVSPQQYPEIYAISEDCAKQCFSRSIGAARTQICDWSRSGHIHNLHGVYNTAVQLMTNGLAKVECTEITIRAAPQPPMLGEPGFKVPQHWGI